MSSLALFFALLVVSHVLVFLVGRSCGSCCCGCRGGPGFDEGEFQDRGHTSFNHMCLTFGADVLLLIQEAIYLHIL